MKNDGIWVFVMRDMRSVNNECCGLSKGTQSDGLISDTSSEEFVSGSSTENLKEDTNFGKIIAKESKAVGNESQNSIRTIYSKTSDSLHQMQARCQIYIRWGVLLSFGILLWIALWIMDLFNPNPFLKEDVAIPKKVTLKAGMMKKPTPSTWWFFNTLHYASNSIISMTTFGIIIILGCATILVYLKTNIRNRWGETIGRLCYVEFFKNLYNTGEDETDPDNSSFHINILEKELASEKSKTKSCGNDSSKFSHGDVRNLMARDETELNSKLGEKNMHYLNQGGRLSTENRISKSLKGSVNANNTRKRSRQVNSGKNYCNFSCRRNNLSRDVVTSELILDKPNFDSSRVPSSLKNDKTKLIPELQSNLTCSIFNKSTSFMSEKIETWFEIPNSDQAEKVMHSFDVEMEEFFKTRNSSSLISFGETTQDLQPFNESSVGYECEEPSKAVISNVEYNRGIISSSPAFRRFLVNLAKDRLSESYL